MVYSPPPRGGATTQDVDAKREFVRQLFGWFGDIPADFETFESQRARDQHTREQTRIERSLQRITNRYNAALESDDYERAAELGATVQELRQQLQQQQALTVVDSLHRSNVDFSKDGVSTFDDVARYFDRRQFRAILNQLYERRQINVAQRQLLHKGYEQERRQEQRRRFRGGSRLREQQTQAIENATENIGGTQSRTLQYAQVTDAYTDLETEQSLRQVRGRRDRIQRELRHNERRQTRAINQNQNQLLEELRNRNTQLQAELQQLEQEEAAVTQQWDRTADFTTSEIATLQRYEAERDAAPTDRARRRIEGRMRRIERNAAQRKAQYYAVVVDGAERNRYATDAVERQRDRVRRRRAEQSTRQRTQALQQDIQTTEQQQERVLTRIDQENVQALPALTQRRDALSNSISDLRTQITTVDADIEDLTQQVREASAEDKPGLEVRLEDARTRRVNLQAQEAAQIATMTQTNDHIALRQRQQELSEHVESVRERERRLTREEERATDIVTEQQRPQRNRDIDTAATEISQDVTQIEEGTATPTHELNFFSTDDHPIDRDSNVARVTYTRLIRDNDPDERLDQNKFYEDGNRRQKSAVVLAAEREEAIEAMTEDLQGQYGAAIGQTLLVYDPRQQQVRPGVSANQHIANRISERIAPVIARRFQELQPQGRREAASGTRVFASSNAEVRREITQAALEGYVEAGFSLEEAQQALAGTIEVNRQRVVLLDHLINQVGRFDIPLTHRDIQYNLVPQRRLSGEVRSQLREQGIRGPILERREIHSVPNAGESGMRYDVREFKTLVLPSTVDAANAYARWNRFRNWVGRNVERIDRYTTGGREEAVQASREYAIAQRKAFVAGVTDFEKQMREDPLGTAFRAPIDLANSVLPKPIRTMTPNFRAGLLGAAAFPVIGALAVPLAGGYYMQQRYQQFQRLSAPYFNTMEYMRAYSEGQVHRFAAAILPGMVWDERSQRMVPSVVGAVSTAYHGSLDIVGRLLTRPNVRNLTLQRIGSRLQDRRKSRNPALLFITMPLFEIAKGIVLAIANNAWSVVLRAYQYARPAYQIYRLGRAIARPVARGTIAAGRWVITRPGISQFATAINNRVLLPIRSAMPAIQINTARFAGTRAAIGRQAINVGNFARGVPRWVMRNYPTGVNALRAGYNGGVVGLGAALRGFGVAFGAQFLGLHPVVSAVAGIAYGGVWAYRSILNNPVLSGRYEWSFARNNHFWGRATGSYTPGIVRSNLAEAFHTPILERMQLRHIPLRTRLGATFLHIFPLNGLVLTTALASLGVPAGLAATAVGVDLGLRIVGELTNGSLVPRIQGILGAVGAGVQVVVSVGFMSQTIGQSGWRSLFDVFGMRVNFFSGEFNRALLRFLSVPLTYLSYAGFYATAFGWTGPVGWVIAGLSTLATIVADIGLREWTGKGIYEHVIVPVGEFFYGEIVKPLYEQVSGLISRISDTLQSAISQTLGIIGMMMAAIRGDIRGVLLSVLSMYITGTVVAVVAMPINYFTPQFPNYNMWIRDLEKTFYSVEDPRPIDVEYKDGIHGNQKVGAVLTYTYEFDLHFDSDDEAKARSSIMYTGIPVPGIGDEEDKVYGEIDWFWRGIDYEDIITVEDVRHEVYQDMDNYRRGLEDSCFTRINPYPGSYPNAYYLKNCRNETVNSLPGTEIYTCDTDVEYFGNPEGLAVCEVGTGCEPEATIPMTVRQHMYKVFPAEEPVVGETQPEAGVIVELVNPGIHANVFETDGGGYEAEPVGYRIGTSDHAIGTCRDQGVRLRRAFKVYLNKSLYELWELRFKNRGGVIGICNTVSVNILANDPFKFGEFRDDVYIKDPISGGYMYIKNYKTDPAQFTFCREFNEPFNSSPDNVPTQFHPPLPPFEPEVPGYIEDTYVSNELLYCKGNDYGVTASAEHYGYGIPIRYKASALQTSIQSTQGNSVAGVPIYSITGGTVVKVGQDEPYDFRKIDDWEPSLNVYKDRYVSVLSRDYPPSVMESLTPVLNDPFGYSNDTKYDNVSIGTYEWEITIPGDCDIMLEGCVTKERREGSHLAIGTGNYVVVDDGSFRIVYGNMDHLSANIGVGSTINPGQVLGVFVPTERDEPDPQGFYWDYLHFGATELPLLTDEQLALGIYSDGHVSERLSSFAFHNICEPRSLTLEYPVTSTALYQVCAGTNETSGFNRSRIINEGWFEYKFSCPN